VGEEDDGENVVVYDSLLYSKPVLQETGVELLVMIQSC